MLNVEAKDPATGAYFKANIVDFKRDKLQVEIGNGWKTEWLEAADVRLPAPTLPVDFSPKAGDVVEVLWQTQTEDAPYGWWLATIKSVKSGVALVKFHGWDDNFNEMIEQDLIRPVNASAAIDLSSFSREEIPIPVGLELNSDSWLPTLQKDSGVSMLSVQDLHNPDGCKVLVALGTDQQCHLASILSNRTFQHLQSLHRMRTHSTSLKQKIHDSRIQLEQCVCEEFNVNPEHVGFVIGRKGRNINSVQQMDGVQSVKVDAAAGRVRIFAKTKELAAEARRRLEWCEERVEVDMSVLGWVIGRGGSNIREIETEAGLAPRSIRIVRGEETADVLFHGRREEVENACMLLNLHLHYRSEFNEARSTERELSREMQRMRIESGVQQRSEARWNRREESRDEEETQIAEEEIEGRPRERALPKKKQKRKRKAKVKAEDEPMPELGEQTLAPPPPPQQGEQREQAPLQDKQRRARKNRNARNARSNRDSRTEGSSALASAAPAPAAAEGGETH